MATANISSHQKQLEFDDNQFLSSLVGYHDKNLKVKKPEEIDIYGNSLKNQFSNVKFT